MSFSGRDARLSSGARWMFLQALRAGALAGAAFLAACSNDETARPYVEQPVEILYNDALDALEAEDFVAARGSFEEVDRQHPYSIWATKARHRVEIGIRLELRVSVREAHFP